MATHGHGDETEHRQLVPAGVEALIASPAGVDVDRLAEAAWSQLELDEIRRPLRLPLAGSYDDLGQFARRQVLLQMEMMRSNIDLKLHLVREPPRGATTHPRPDKHVRIILPANVRGRRIVLDLESVQKEPSRGVYTNYIFVLQKRGPGDAMDNVCLAYCTKMRKGEGGVEFALGRDADERLEDLGAGTVLFGRPLVNCNMWKVHVRAIAALNEARRSLADSFVVKQLLSGKIDCEDLKSISDLDGCINSTSYTEGTPIDLSEFNTQQQRALAMDELTSKGLVLIQGPPGTGKSRIICHGILPQAVARGEKVLVICNSNVAVDALMVKCIHDDKSRLRGKMRRCGFKKSVSDEVTKHGLYIEGDVSAAGNAYGDVAGCNSNTMDTTVQTQISGADVIFTTIHFASKEKARSANSSEYWQFDTLILDEAAQIEDAKIFIILARCPSLKKIILVGDPKQLQPYVPDTLRKLNYGISTMERLMNASGDASHIMLEEQYRMAPPLRSVVSCLYYNNRLTDSQCVLENGPRADEMDLKPLCVINVTGTTMTYSRKYHSYENKSEAAVVKAVYNFLFEKNPSLGNDDSDLKFGDVCILTPYNRHKDRIRMEICGVEEEALEAYSGVTFSSTTSGTPLASPNKSQAVMGSQQEVDPDTAAKLENIDTVDKFQGSERKVVIISPCVSDNPRRAADPHFINVACSRAKHLLIIVGNFTDGLVGNTDWRYIFDEAKSSGSYIEHRVNERAINADDADDEAACDINEHVLLSGLLELLGPLTKKIKRGD